MANIASRDPRLVPFSVLYHTMMRHVITAAEAVHAPLAGHDYSHTVSNAVLLAAFVTEATINEIAYWLEGHLTRPVALPNNFDRSDIRAKWRTLPGRCGAAGFDETSETWVDFDTLINLRNALAHPPAYSRGREPVLQRLDELGLTQPAGDWFESVMTLRTARWARRTASEMPQTLRRLLEPHIDMHNGGFSWVWTPEWLPAA